MRWFSNRFRRREKLLLVPLVTIERPRLGEDQLEASQRLFIASSGKDPCGEGYAAGTRLYQETLLGFGLGLCPASWYGKIPRCLALKNHPAVTLGTLEKCRNQRPSRNCDGTGMDLCYFQNGDNYRENCFASY
ncbi:hypothetical protein TNCV_3506611 [Trichonephila clavipes]|uniref:Uncharacterized protein n=1 Tax=Trichonephila clavipes TaxID=2585209 RepID=A0A8X6S694_TRICX|nr:hypothetical protein TNCV_3506611 [Trichonephila clavipes]